MFEAEADIGVGGEVKHRVGAPHRRGQFLGVRQIALDQAEIRMLQGLFQEGPPAGRKIVEADNRVAPPQQLVD